jgi:hypothetical protein
LLLPSKPRFPPSSRVVAPEAGASLRVARALPQSPSHVRAPPPDPAPPHPGPAMDTPLVTSPADVAARASSVLKGNARQFGPARMFDGCPDTCWNSDAAAAAGGGGGQWVELELKRGPAAVAAVEVTFQGGFVGQECAVSVRPPGGGGEWVRVAEFEPDDTNAPQRVPLPPGSGDGGDGGGVGALRLDFARSTDFYGRVTIYRLELFGRYLPGARQPGTSQQEPAPAPAAGQ